MIRRERRRWCPDSVANLVIPPQASNNSSMTKAAANSSTFRQPLPRGVVMQCSRELLYGILCLLEPAAGLFPEPLDRLDLPAGLEQLVTIPRMSHPHPNY